MQRRGQKRKNDASFSPPFGFLCDAHGAFSDQRDPSRRFHMLMTHKLALAVLAAATFTGSAVGADRSRPAQMAPVIQAPAQADWAGAYVGVNGGYGWGTVSGGGASASTSGWFVGGQVGYNFHLSNTLVGGVEGDLAWTNEAATIAGMSYRTNWDGSVRGRLGVDLDGILPYAEAGVAFANATLNGNTATHTGWTAGAGVEFKLADQVSANLEYRYSDYGSQTYAGTSYTVTDSTARVGVNYHF
jgi:outer membrane immunogenic protein